MNDKKSKLPDLKEITSISSKLFRDLTTSVKEIIQDYKAKRQNDNAPAEATTKKTAAPKPAEPATDVKDTEIQTSVDIEAKPTSKPAGSKPDKPDTQDS